MEGVSTPSMARYFHSWAMEKDNRNRFIRTWHSLLQGIIREFLTVQDRELLWHKRYKTSGI